MSFPAYHFARRNGPAPFRLTSRLSPYLPALLLCATIPATSPLARAANGRATSSHLASPSALRCAGAAAPLALASSHPDFSWQLTASLPTLHGVSQTAYQIQVRKGFSPANSLVLWDTGAVHSRATSDISYAGPELTPGEAYQWRVRAWDERAQPSAWSAWARWSQAPVWHAAWIAERISPSDTAPMPLFRKSFRLTGVVRRAMLYATGLGQDEIRINGAPVTQDLLTPGWTNYRKTVAYDAYDVTARLHPGQNVLGVLLGNGMYRVLHTPGRYTKFTGSFGPPKCIVQLDLTMADGRQIKIASDDSWKTHPGPIVFSSTYGGEDFDARREPIGWGSPGFRDADWSPAAIVDGPGGTLIPELAPPIRVMHVYAPVRVTHPAAGITVYDLGQNFAGWPAIRVTGPPGSSVRLIPGELLDETGRVSQRSSGRPQWFTYTLRGTGVERWHPRFSYYGFRYVQVEATAAHGSAQLPRVLALAGQAVHTTSPQVGSFSSSSDLLNRIHTLILRAIENNAVSLFTDCPHREKLGWLEETHLMAPSMLYDFDFSGLYAATARNIADTQTIGGEQDGMVPEIAPQYVVFDPKHGVFDDSPEWGSAAVLAPWYVYERTGDLDFLRRQYDVMRRYVAYLATRASGNIIAYGLGDWYDIGPGAPGFSKLTTMGLTATATYYQDLRVLEHTAALLGQHDESAQYGQQAVRVRDAFNARFFDPAQHRYDKGSQTAQAMPLALGIVPAGERAAVLAALVRDIRAHQNHVTAGDIGFHYVVDALIQGGRSDVLLDMLQRTDAPSYGYQLQQGATSLTEAWDANPASSQDHFMLGDGEEWFYRGLGGIRVDRSLPPAQQITLRPAVPTGFDWVRTRYLSSLGPIESEWRRNGAQLVYDFSIPANSTAFIEVQANNPRAVTINGHAASAADGVLSMHVDGPNLRIEVSSGTYRIVAPAKAPSQTR
jgi:alpha-L-rhamnosidase